MDKVTTWIWYDGGAEEAAIFYVSLLPDSRVEKVWKTPADTPSGPAGTTMTVEFTLCGRSYCGLNGGSQFPQSEALSIMVLCDDQAEVDRLWSAFLDNGGTASVCGWLKDRWGVSWQITPRRLMELNSDPDPARARRTMEAMMTMGKIDIATLERAADGA